MPAEIRHLEDVLEDVKQMGNYAVSMYFGEGMGCDDSVVRLHERSVKIIASPVGFLGGLRMAWVGTIPQLVEMDLKGEPEILSNPPKRLPEFGIFIWGPEDNVERYFRRKHAS